MIWVALIYIAGIIAFNLFGVQGNIYWGVQYYVFVHGIIAALAFDIRSFTVQPGKRRVYFILGCFSCYYVLFNIAALIGGGLYRFLGVIDSYLWSVVSAAVALVLLISYFRHDKHAKNGRD